MPCLLTRHRVAEFTAWQRAFDEDAEIRRANGSEGAIVFRNSADPHEVWVLLEWDDLTRARLFVRSDDWNDLLIRAGVAGRPDYWFLEGTSPSTP